MIHYNFIGVLDLPEVEEYPDNVVLDSGQGVAIEYLVGQGRLKETEQPDGRSTGADSPYRNSKGTAFRLFLYIRVFICVMNTRYVML